MIAEQRIELRRTIGVGVLKAQRRAALERLTPDDVIPEVLAALLSLAADIAYHNAHLDSASFMIACEAAAKEIWGKDSTC